MAREAKAAVAEEALAREARKAAAAAMVALVAKEMAVRVNCAAWHSMEAQPRNLIRRRRLQSHHQIRYLPNPSPPRRRCQGKSAPLWRRL